MARRNSDHITFNMERVLFGNVRFNGISVTGPKEEVYATIDYLLSLAERYNAVR